MCFLYAVPFAVYFLMRMWLGYVAAPDTLAYLEMGRGIFEKSTFGYLSENGEYVPNALRVPVIPFVLGALYAVLGNAEMTYSIYSWLLVFVAPALPCTAFYFGRQVGRGTAWTAWAFLVVHPNVIMCMLYVLTDIPFAFLSCLVYISLWRALEAGTYRRFGIAGLATGVACMLRPIMKLYFLAAAAIMIMRRVRLRCLAAFLLVFAVVVAPWLLRNLALYGRPVFETSQGVNLLWSNAGLVQLKDSDSSETRRLKNHILANKETPMTILMFEGKDYWVRHDLEVSDRLQQIAVEAYRDNPLGVVKNWGRQVATLTGSTSHCYDLYKKVRESGAVRWVSERLPALRVDTALTVLYVGCKWAMRGLYLVVSLAGLIMLVLYGYRKIALFAAMNILYFTCLIAFVTGYDRYRLNMEPLFAVLIVFPFCAMAAAVRRRLTQDR